MAHSASYTMDTGVKRPGRGVDHSFPFSAEVKERLELYLYPPTVSSWQVLIIQPADLFAEIMSLAGVSLMQEGPSGSPLGLT